MRQRIFFAVFIVAICSCTSNRSLPSVGESNLKSSNETYQSSLGFNDNNYLVFSDQKSFEEAVKYLQENEGSSLRSANGISVTIPENFKSISTLQKELEYNTNHHDQSTNNGVALFRSTNSSVSSSATGSSTYDSETDSYYSDLEEMTEEEFSIFKSEELLLEPAFYELMDSTMRVQISDTLYVVTEVGTFAAHKNDKQTLYETIYEVRDIAEELPNIQSVVPVQDHHRGSSQEYYEKNNKQRENYKTTLSTLERGDEYRFNNRVKYINSFGRVDNPYNDGWYPTNTPIDPIYIYNEEALYPQFHEPYNVITEKWKNKTFFGKLWSKVVGKDIQRTNNFDKKHRVALQVYDVNYGFYTNTGIKVKFQQRKRFLGVPYWKAKQAQKMVVGFNSLHGVYRQKNPNNIDANARPFLGSDWKEFSGNIEKINAKFVHRIYSDINIFKNWSNKINVILPKIDAFGINVIDPHKVAKMLYELPEKQMVAFLNTNAKKYVLDPYRKSNFTTPPDPRIAYITYGESIFDFSTKTYVMGVKEYSNIMTKTVTLNIALGFTLKNSGGIYSCTPFLPTTFDLKSFDLFGAVYYNNEWRGVRMVTE